VAAQTAVTSDGAPAKVIAMGISYESGTIDAFVTDHALDVARDGIFVRSKDPPTPSTLVKFYIKTADGSTALTGVGRIVWASRDPSVDHPPGFGMHFIKLDDPSAAVLSRMLKHQTELGEPSFYQSAHP